MGEVAIDLLHLGFDLLPRLIENNNPMYVAHSQFFL